MEKIINYLEHATGLVHADSEGGDDHTLCGVTTERDITGEKYADYKDSEDKECAPCVSKTTRKITCPKCADIIRHCCSLGVESIGNVRDDNFL